MSRVLLNKPAVALGALAVITMAGGVLAAAEPDAFNRFAGRWAGPGTLSDASGPGESFKCVVTYLPGADGASVDQKLRCKGDSYNLDAATTLKFEGKKISGEWQDNIHSLSGTLAGDLTATGFDVQLDGQFFAAKMTVVSAACEQAVTVVPTKGATDTMAANLKRC